MDDTQPRGEGAMDMTVTEVVSPRIYFANSVIEFIKRNGEKKDRMSFKERLQYESQVAEFMWRLGSLIMEDSHSRLFERVSTYVREEHPSLNTSDNLDQMTLNMGRSTDNELLMLQRMITGGYADRVVDILLLKD